MTDDAIATTRSSGIRRWLSALAARRVIGRLDLSAGELAAAAGSGAFLSCAYLVRFLSVAAIPAPAVLLYLAARRRPVAASVIGAVFGLAFGGFGVSWMLAVTGLGWAGLTAIFALSFAGLAAAVSVTTRGGIPVSAAAPALWVTIELIRAHVFTGFPWLFLGHAFSDWLVLIQIADLGGAYAVSFVVALAAAAAVDLARGRDRTGWGALAAAGAAACVTLAYGAWRMASVETRDGPRLVLIQGNIDTPSVGDSEDAMREMDERIWRVHADLSVNWASGGDLLVWSESMLPGRFGALSHTGGEWHERLKALLGEVGRPLLTGSSALGLHPDVPSNPAPSDADLTGPHEYNSAFLLDTEAEIVGRYDKTHLVPFGEYTPLSRWPVFSGLTPYAAGDPGYRHGDPRQPLMRLDGCSFGVLICYESVFASLARRAVRLGADFLVNLSSEAWFAGTAEIPQHLRIARFRTVENRVPLVRCCNVGVTAFIDPAGRIVSRLGAGSTEGAAQGALAGPVPLAARPGGTVYAAVGDLFAYLAAGAAFLLVALACLRPRRE